MELKFLSFTFLLLFVVFGGIESEPGRSRGSSSRGSSSRGSSSRGSSSHGSSSWGSSSHGSSFGSGNHGSSSSTWHSSSSNHGSSGGLLSSERNHGSSSSSSSSSRNPYRPFATVPPPPPKNTGNNHNPFRPFATVPPPPPKNTGTNWNRPFATVPPPPRHTDHNNNRVPKPFATVPPPRNTGPPTGAPPPPGFILPGSTTHPRPGITPGIHAGTQRPPVVPPGPHYVHRNTSSGANFGPNTRLPAGPGPNYGRHNTSTSVFPSAPVHETHYPTQGAPPPGFVIPPNTRPPTGGISPNPPVHPTHYPGQQSHPNYPQQPPYNPAFTNHPPPFYSPYPHQPSYVQPGPTHVQPSYAQPQYVHTLPPNPVQTVVVVPGHSGYQRTTGDIFKEALIHAGVNAAVNRITSPSHYHDHYYGSSWNNNYHGTPPGQNTVTNTHIVNNNYYDQTPGGSGNIQGGSNPPPNYNTQSYPGSGTQGGSPGNFNPQDFGNHGNSGNSDNSGNYGSVHNNRYPQNGDSNTPTNGQSQPSQSNGQGQANYGYIEVWDQELLNITEKLFGLDENNATKFITLNLQKQEEANNTNVTDQSPLPLFSIQPEAYDIPTVRAIRSLYQAASEMENKTRLSSRKEEALFVDLILNTNVMTVAMDFLAQKKLIKSDYYEHKDALKHLWFTPYDGTSSGFKRIFQGENWQGILWGIQDWVAFDFYEKAGRANYFSYVQKTDLGKVPPYASILKTNFEMSGNMRTGTSLFIGTSPELQMALYTICHYTRPNNYCNISLGGTTFQIYTHMDRYFGEDLINVAFPIL